MSQEIDRKKANEHEHENKIVKAGDLDRKERINGLHTEMTLLQGAFNKYDDLIFRNRAWLMAGVGALLFATIRDHKWQYAFYAEFIVIFFYISEVIWRWRYWYKYVKRYRRIRDSLKDGKPIESLLVYDLTDKYGQKISNKDNIKMFLKTCVIKTELIFHYGTLLMASEILRRYIK